jgi:hypothetical protein
MLIKQADDASAHLAALEAQAQGGGANAKRAETELRTRRAGLRGEREAAYLIDFDYAASPNWAVIHDLRLEHGGRVAQIDHLLINRWMDVYVLETKSFHAGVKITEDGEFLRWNDYRKTYEGMASPIEQNERHIQVLRDAMAQIELPMRLGARIAPSFHSFVLVSPKAKVYRPTRFDTSRVIKADQLKKAIWRDIDNENALLSLLKTAAKIVSGETVDFVARQLAALHRPLRVASEAVSSVEVGSPPDAVSTTPAPMRIEPALDPSPSSLAAPIKPEAATVAASMRPDGATEASATTCTCKACRSSRGSVLYGKYGYYFKCQDCSTNTAIRFSCAPGHAPRLRGERGSFFRECADCGSSDLFHRNPAAGESAA